MNWFESWRCKAVMITKIVREKNKTINMVGHTNFFLPFKNIKILKFGVILTTDKSYDIFVKKNQTLVITW